MTDDSGNVNQADTFGSLTSAAERILSDVFSDPIRFTNVQRLSEPGRRNLLLRCFHTPARHMPSTFIIKKVEADSYHPEDLNSWDSQRFISDWIGSQFLSSLGDEANHGPHFYGGNLDLGFIILEDMGDHRSLVEPLLHEDRGSAEAALLRYSTRLGKLHADTFNQYDVFENLFQRLGVKGKSFAPTEQELEESIQKVQTILDRLGVQMEPTFLKELGEIRRALIYPGPFMAYIHGDPCPDNVFDSNEQMRLIDFEFGHFGHALIDATYGRMLFPTCWCANRLPRSMVEQMENRYRTELIQACPQAQEDSIFEHALITSCGFWLLNSLAWHLERSLEEDRNWGIASVRQRILARLEAFMTISEELDHFPAIHGTAGRLLDLMHKRWSEIAPLPLYPAFESVSFE